MSRTCYIPTTIDSEIAIKLGWNPQTKQGEFNPYRIATLRGMYDDEHPNKHIDTSNVETAAQELASYRQYLKSKVAKEIHSAGTNLVKSYRQLRAAFTSEEQFNRVTMISTMISQLLDNVQRMNPGVSRTQLLEGYESNGRKVGGQMAFFEKVYEVLLDRQSQYMALPNGQGKEKADKITKVLENWGALTTYVRIRLRDTEGIKLNNKEDFMSEANLDNLDDNRLSELLDMSESKREAWQDANDMKSAFGNIGSKVRSVISMIPRCSRNANGVITVERDDLGCEKMLDPVRVHQQLLDLLRGMTNSIDMMNRLAKMSQTQAWIEPLFRYLQANPQVKTQFFVDFKKNFQKYSIIQRDTDNERNGVRRFKTVVLNRVRDKLGSAFNMRITGSPLTNDSVYNSKGNINWANLRKVRQTILDWLDVKEPENSKKGVFGSQVKTYNGSRNKYFTAGGTSQQRRDFIVNTSRALGIDIDADTANSLMNDRNKKDLNAYLRNLYELVQYGIDPSIGTADLERLLKGENLGERLYRSMVKNSGKSIRFREKIDKLNTLVTKHREGLRVDSRVVRKDSKGNSVSLFSNVNPSYMGDKLELITSYIEANDKKGLKQFLEQEYLSSSFFMNDGKILNRWLRDLYEACNSNKSLEDFAGIFDYQRFLGTPDLNSEDFTSKQDAISMIHMYASDSQISPNATTALYPVFVLGDSGVSKYIRQKRYTEDEIIDGFYDVYLQEIQRRKAVSSVNQKLDDLGHRQNGYVKSVNGEEVFVNGRGYSKIENFSDTGEKFTMLQFLNEDKYKLGDNPTEQDVKNVIKRYLDDSYKDFLRKFNRLGVFETRESNENVNGKVEKVKRYTYLDQILFGKDPNKVMSDFYRNVKFATIQQLQLMTIDPAFHKGTKGLQKRYKGTHSPGTILDIYAKDFNGQLYSQDGTETCIYFEDIEVSANKEFLDVIAAFYDVTFDEEGNLIGKNAEIYKKYTKNTLTDGQGYRTLTSYRKVLGMAGQWTREMENAYNQIMTLRETYGKNAIPTEELRKIEELAVIFKPIKPFMFTHEHLPINSNDSQIIPVQHKYAEAVLIPELLPQDSKLKDIAYYMEENNVDLLGSTTICKIGCFGATSIDHLDQYDSEIIDRRKAQGDNNTDISNTERLNFAMSQAFVHKLSYSDYRIQTNVPDHVYNSQLFGTQVRKINMAGVIKYDEHGNLIDPKDASGHYKYEHYVDNQKVNLGGKAGMVRLNSRNLIAFYNSLIVANELESYQKFEESIKSKKGLSDRLIQSVISNSREPIDNLLSFGLNESGDFSVPLFEGGLEHDTAAMLLSMYKKLVNKQTINGGSAVQVSAMGIKDYSEDGGLRCVTDGKNNILYAECEIPFNLSYKDQNGNVVSLDYDTYCNEDGTLKMKNEKPLLEWDFPGILSMITYRIPTERAYSIINLKIVRFSRKTAGGTIKVPVQFTTIVGFDFDVDKLYFMRREFDATKDNDEAVNKLLNDIMGSNSIEWEEYDLSKPPMENTRAARNNMLIHLIQQRLMDPETLEQRTTPGGFSNASKSARKMRELFFGSLEGIVNANGTINWETLDSRSKDKKSDPEPDYDPSDPMTIIIYNQQNQIAGKLIGIFANHNTNHAFASLMKKFRIKRGSEIEFAGHTILDGYGFDLLHGPKGVDVDLNLAEFLAASVDAVKDPVLNFLNFNTLTADSGAFLARIGYNTMEIGLLFNQPIIKEVCDYAFNNGLKLDDAIRDITKQYSQKFGLKEVDTIDSNVTSIDAMAKNIVDYRQDSQKMNTMGFVSNQLQLLKLFKKVSSLASEVSQFVTSTKFTASNAVGSTFGDMYAQQMKVNNYITKLNSDDASSIEIELTDFPVSDYSPIKGEESRLNMTPEEYASDVVYNPLAYEQTMYDLNRKALRAMSKYYPYEKPMYRNIRMTMMNLTRGKYLDGDTINSIHRDLMTYLLAQQERSDFNGEITKHTEHGDMSTREYYTKYFAKDLFTFLQNNPEFKDMPIFEYLMFEADNEGTISMNIQGIGGLAPYQKDAIRDSWTELNRTKPLIARDLFLYNFYKLGFDFSPLTFMNLAPTEVKQTLLVPSEDNPARTYVDFLNQILKGEFDVSHNKFAKQYILNHPDNYRLVYQAKSKEAKKILRPLAFEAGEAKSRFTLDVSSNKDAASMFVLSSDKKNGIMHFVPAIQISDSVFIANGTSSDFNMSTTGTMEYIRMDTLGSNKSKNYHSEGFSTGKTSTIMASEDASTGSTSITADEVPQVETPSFDRQGLINSMAKELLDAMKRIGEDSLEDGSPMTVKFIEDMILNPLSDEDLLAQAELIKKACRENGVIMLDENGEPMQGC